MSDRGFRVLAVSVMMLLTSVVAVTPVAGQSTARGRWEALRTPWGDPDLQGIWSSSGATPMERPDRYQGRELLTDEEVATIRGETAARDGEQVIWRAREIDQGSERHGAAHAERAAVKQKEGEQ